MVAKHYLDGSGRIVKPFKNNFPSYEWACSFLKRHSQKLQQRIYQNIKCVRASVSAEEIRKYFDNLKRSLVNDDGTPINDDHIFNYDETNLCDDPGVKRCVFRRGIKYPERIQDSTKSSTSIMFCGSASGSVLPPYVVYKYDNIWNTWMEGGPANTRYNRTKSCLFDATTFADWFVTSFIPQK